MITQPTQPIEWMDRQTNCKQTIDCIDRTASIDIRRRSLIKILHAHPPQSSEPDHPHPPSLDGNHCCRTPNFQPFQLLCFHIRSFHREVHSNCLAPCTIHNPPSLGCHWGSRSPHSLPPSQSSPRDTLPPRTSPAPRTGTYCRSPSAGASCPSFTQTCQQCLTTKRRRL